MKTPHLQRDDLLYPDLSYRVIGILFDVDNNLGPGHKEKYYENAVAQGLTAAGLRFERQLYVPLVYNGKTIGRYFLDFLVEGKLVLELKQGRFFAKQNIEQVYSYLKAHKLQLGIIAQFTSEGLKYKRVVNLQ